MPSSTNFMALALLSEIVLCGRSKSIRKFQSALRNSASKLQKHNINLVNAYVPTFSAFSEVKDSSYETLTDNVRLMNIDESLFILRNFNACVGSHSPQALGYHVIGKRVLEVSKINDLAIINTLLPLKDQRKVSWCHPRSKH